MSLLSVISVVLVASAIGVGLLLRASERGASKALPLPGWVYFLSPIGGGNDEPPAPIKIGMTHRDPARERLPEIATMSPEPLELLHTIPSHVPELLELTIHKELAPFRRHGEWFDRDATLAWLDQFKGAI